ncbi:peroxiredoxin [Spirosoma sp. KNUC1025]|uniref:peroxiredoxin n=1 Tax=Spirosoma sp. KNUC1025 TaxID=2894082 RepID=UPI003865FD2B|nr:peroxiredoxin [Spirosoma sp. KNUC1025]
MAKPLEIGDPIPLFILKDQHGKGFHVHDWVGKKKLVIYFYPKDESGICTKEACAFRDSYQDFTDAGALVIGINAGTSASHLAFAQHHRLPFTLLSDPDNRVLTEFGIKSMLFLTGRETFVFDLSGKLVYKYKGFFNGSAHAEEVLQFLREINQAKQ